MRWADRFFEANSAKDKLEMVAGTGNTNAIGSTSGSNSEYIFYLEDSAANAPVSENEATPQKAPLLKPEILSFDYPFTFEDYAAVLANPYGKIVVDGEECYIQKITPTLIKGTANFELIPKNS